MGGRGAPSGLDDDDLVLDGRRFHARVSRQPHPATAPTVVLVHGLVASGRYLVPTAELLAPHFNVTVPDLPGFGLSEAPDHALDVIELADALHRFLVAIGVAGAVLVAHSFGCQVVAHAAVRHPDAIDQAILMAPTFDPEAGGAVGMAARWLGDAVHEPLAAHLVMSVDLLRCGLRRGLATYRQALHDRLEDQLPLLTVPTLVLRGARDPVAPRRWVEQVASLAPRGEVAEVPGAGHLAHWTHPFQVAELLRSFIARASR